MHLPESQLASSLKIETKERTAVGSLFSLVHSCPDDSTTADFGCASYHRFEQTNDGAETYWFEQKGSGKAGEHLLEDEVEASSELRVT